MTTKTDWAIIVIIIIIIIIIIIHSGLAGLLRAWLTKHSVFTILPETF
jgi:hypothetical protein